MAARGILRQFTRVEGPTDRPSVAVMDTCEGDEHIAVCYRYRLLHLTERGVENFPIEAYAGQYVNMRFYQ